MPRTKPLLGWAVLMVAAMPAIAQQEDAFGGDAFEEETVEVPMTRHTATALGERDYRAHCATCHGIDGAGAGPSAAWLDPPPRNFTRGEYKWRSTPSGTLPTDDDLLLRISEGVHGTSMPAWRGRLPESTRRILVQYIKTFSNRFDQEPVGVPITVPPAPEPTPALIDQGRAAYERLKCGECHGPDGAGDGPAAPTLQDSQDRPIVAHDFTRGYVKAGATPEIIYQIFMTGLDGTPMPAYDQTTTREERWPLVLHTLSLRQPRSWLDYLLEPLEEQ